MYVPNMTIPEIRDETLKERDYLIRVSVREGQALEKHFRKYKISAYSRITFHRSPAKNLWGFHWRLTPKGLSVGHFCKYNLHKRFAVVRFNSLQGTIHFASSHFYSRFHERMGLSALTSDEVVSHFVLNNTLPSYRRFGSETDHGIRVFVQLQDGVGLGYLKPDLDWVEYRTFITHDMLSARQNSISEELRSLILNYRSQKFDEKPPATPKPVVVPPLPGPIDWYMDRDEAWLDRFFDE
jgi:hypothetical protein